MGFNQGEMNGAMARAFLETERKLILVSCDLELDLESIKIHPVYQMTSISVAILSLMGFSKSSTLQHLLAIKSNDSGSTCTAEAASPLK